MADLYEPDCGTAFYRSRDPIKNLKVRVRIKKLTSTSIVPQAVLEKEHGVPTAGVQNLNLKAATAAPRNDWEEYTFSWQEKLFSQREVDRYIHEQNCLTIQEKTYHSQVQLLQEKGRPTVRLFSYTEHDEYTNRDETAEAQTNYSTEQPTRLSSKMANVRRRRTAGSKLREGDNAIVPKINIVDLNPSEESRRKHHLITTPLRTMHIMADISPKDSEATEDDEHRLCTIKVDSNGVISIKPDFNKHRKSYRVENGNLGRDVYEYILEHASNQMNRQEQDRERKMYKELYARHSEFLEALVGYEFEMPPPGVLRLLVHGEIVSAKDFEYDDLYIHFFVELPKHWSAEGNQQLSWVTQTCATKVVGRDNVAYFSFPFNFELFYRMDPVFGAKEDELPHWPQVYIEVLSLDSWQRYRTEGYTYITIPNTTGTSTHTLHCWRPTGRSAVSELRRFFIGGSPELEDTTYTAVSSTFEGTHLSKFGFKTISTGSVEVKFNILQQSQSFLQTAASRKSVGNLVDRLGVNPANASILNVLDAFQKARERMVNARENLTKEFIQTYRDTDHEGETDA